MRHSIKNEQFEVSVLTTGAELCSLRSLSSGKEYIWQADPSVWGAHAPNLFPIIGCLKEDAFLYKGKEYACPKHGFFRKNDQVSLVESTTDSLTFGLTYYEETLKVYPFMFEFLINFVLEENTLRIKHTVINHDEKDMLFSIGGHPGFTCPLHKAETYSDYYLEFEMPETAETWRVQLDGLIGPHTRAVLDTPRHINLHPHLFDDDALVFKNLNSSRVSLKSRKSAQVVSVEFEDFPYLGIWAKPNANYVCIEPWIGIADSADSNRNFESKEGLVRIEPGGSFVASYSIIIKE